MKARCKVNKATAVVLVAVGIMAVAAVAAWIIITAQGEKAQTALIFEDGVMVREVPLTGNTSTYTIELARVTVMVQGESVAVVRSDCPDQICVHTGFIHDGVIPIICMPNKIQIIIR
jgi:hypothetical protein